MRTPIAWLNLFHNKVRVVLAATGVTFAITLMFMQLGIFGSVQTTAVQIYDKLNFDLVLTSPDYVSMTQSGTIPDLRLNQALAVPEVRRVMPVYLNRIPWRNPQTRGRRAVIVIGFAPQDPVFDLPEVEAQQVRLTHPRMMLVDRLSKAELGPVAVGQVAEVGNTTATVAGRFTLGPGFEAGLVLVGAQGYSRLFQGYPLSAVSLGLITLEPGSDVESAARKLKQVLPPDVRVLTRSGMEGREKYHWIVNTNTGIIFGSGVVVAFAFGVVIIYQILSTEVATRLPEYATMKAMGYSDNYLSLVVLQQAAILSVLGYVPGYFMALGIYEITRAATNLPIAMTSGRAVFVFVLTVVMCSVSAILSIRIVKMADPAELY